MFYSKDTLPFVYLVALSFLSGCASAPSSPSASKTVEVPTEATYFDSSIFDQDLSSKLSQNPDKFVVKPSTAINVNKLPERMDKWLSKVKQEDGSVQLKEYSQDATGTKDMTILIDMAVKLFDLAQESMLYSPAKGYDAVVEYEKGTGDVKQIMFYKKNR